MTFQPSRILRVVHKPLSASRIVLPRFTQSITHSRTIKSFSTSSRSSIRSSELTPSLLSSLRANPTRLWNDIHATAQFGIGNSYGDRAEETGLNRLALTAADKQARDWFVETTKKLGCHTFVDEIGNIFAVRPGLHSYDDKPLDGAKPKLDILNIPATFAGSHLDSQPQGGRFDGVLGVCAGVEMLRVLEENWIETEGPVGVVNWTNEEGKRWKRSMMGSAVWAEGRKEELEKVWALSDMKEDGGMVTVKQELENIGYLGEMAASATSGMKMAGHFELHIEQGKRLEKTGDKVAVVSGVQGYQWFTIAVTGSEAHAGATGWEDRADAVLWASRAVVELTKIVKGHGGLATVGCFEVTPGSVNVVPGKVKMTLDVRCETNHQLKRTVDYVKQNLKRMMTRNRNEDDGLVCQIDIKEDFRSEAMRFTPIAMEYVEESAKSVTGKVEVPRLISRAGHDSVNTAKHCPTAMIFVPCKDGVTHNVKEWCSEEDCAIGASVLLQSVLKFDQWRHKQGHFV